LVGKLDGRRPLGRPRYRRGDNIKKDLNIIILYFSSAWKYMFFHCLIIWSCVRRKIVYFSYIYMYVICENLSTMVWNVGNSTPKQTNIKKCFTAQLIFYYFIEIWHLEKLARGVSALYVHCFSMYINSLFHNLVKVVPKATLWSQDLRTDQYKSSQQSTVINLDWQHALNISVFHFVTTTRYRRSIG
jgi:hypothetical protein